jgi:hypothetical protein
VCYVLLHVSRDDLQARIRAARPELLGGASLENDGNSPTSEIARQVRCRAQKLLTKAPAPGLDQYGYYGTRTRTCHRHHRSRLREEMRRFSSTDKGVALRKQGECLVDLCRDRPGAHDAASLVGNGYNLFHSRRASELAPGPGYREIASA